MKIILYSKLSINQCIENLKTNTRKIVLGSTSLSVLFNYWDLDNKYFVKIKGNNFRLERMYVRNTYAPIFIGKFTEISSNKTKIEGKLETRSSTTIFFVIWFAFITLFAVSAIPSIFTTMIKGPVSIDTLIPAFIPFILLSFGIYIFKAMKKQAQQWEKEIIEFMKKTLEADSSKL